MMISLLSILLNRINTFNTNHSKYLHHVHPQTCTGFHLGIYHSYTYKGPKASSIKCLSKLNY